MATKTKGKNGRDRLTCILCGGRIEEGEARCGDKGTLYQGKPLCETCFYEDEACATLYFGEDPTPQVLGEARNETDGEFVLNWHSTDAWRGHYEVTSSRYTTLNEAELLAWHESQTMLVNFDKVVRGLFEKHNINYARAFARTSNVFCQNYFLFVEKSQTLLASLLVGFAKTKVDYENSKWWRGVLFDEGTLDKLSQLFPEEHIKTDADAVKLAEKQGENLIPELVSRLRGKQATDCGQQ